MATTTVRLDPARRNELRAFVESVENADGVTPLSENKVMRLDGGLDARELIVLENHEVLIGYGQAAWHRGADQESGHWALELVVAPEHRTGDVVGDLIESLACDVGHGDMILWSRADYVTEAATAGGWAGERVLWEMRRALPLVGAAAAVSGFRFTTFRMGVDGDAWLEANNVTFAGHPENGEMTRRDLEDRMGQPWFDPEGFFLAWEDDRLVGSCWTKIHAAGMGEIYIIGVIPGWEGRGLGRALVDLGLDYLSRSKHATEAMLYVEAANRRATRLYKTLGFEVTGTVVAYRYAPNA